MNEQFATAADFRKHFKKRSYQLIEGGTVEFKALTPLDVINIQKDVIDRGLLDMGVKDLDDIPTRQAFMDNLSDAGRVEFMMEVGRRVIVHALLKPQFTQLPVGPESEKVHVSEITPSATIDLYLAIEEFSGIERTPIPEYKDVPERDEIAENDDQPGDAIDEPLEDETSRDEAEVSDTADDDTEVETDAAPDEPENVDDDSSAIEAIGSPPEDEAPRDTDDDTPEDTDVQNDAEPVEEEAIDPPDEPEIVTEPDQQNKPTDE